MKIKTQDIVKIGLVAGIYFVLTKVLAPISYGQMQFRVAEVFNLLAFFNPIYIVAVSIGCFLSNLGSPLGIIDVIIGSLHTFISLYFMWKIKNLKVAALMPAVFSFLIAMEICVLENLWSIFGVTYLWIAISEFVICFIIGLPVYYGLKKSGFIKQYIEDSNFKKDYTM